MSLSNVLKRFSGSPTKWLGEPQGTAETRIPTGVSPGSLSSPAKNNIPSANDENRPTPGLLEVTKRMAEFYQYEPDELTYALNDARQHPDTWRELVRNDRHAALFINPLPEHQIEVVKMLRADSALRYGFVTRQEGENIIVTLAVRDVAVCDLSIPASNYDPMTFWKTIQEVTQ